MQQDKASKATHPGLLSHSKSLKIHEDVTEVALDAEIDKLLEEKAAKTNLSVVNVKSVIRQVVQNQMVQKMITVAVRRKERAERKKDKGTLLTDGNGTTVSSDENDDDEDMQYYEPKLTRAKTKELLENQVQPPLWPISPGKFHSSSSPSEAQILITHDLPEESEPEDEEYIPQESDLHHSDDDSVSRSSFSDMGSPATPTRSSISDFALRSKRKRNGEDKVDSVFSIQADSLFKTPSPRPKRGRPLDNAIGLRTRSKLPLNDTPLEALEKQLIPPDITTDMYEWNETGNEDYLDFLKAFMYSEQTTTVDEGHDDEEADPEYNVMEEEEDDHDQEEHRVDRAVKVPRKELNDLFAELYEYCHFSSNDEMEDTLAGPRKEQAQNSTAAATILSPSASNTTVAKSSAITSSKVVVSPSSNNPIALIPPPREAKPCSASSSNTLNEITGHFNPDETGEGGSNNVSPLVEALPSPSIPGKWTDAPPTATTPIHVQKSVIETHVLQEIVSPIEETLFSSVTYTTLQHQLQQHVQLLTQSYILSAQIEEPAFVRAAQISKSLLLTLDKSCRARGPTSALAVKNLQDAVQLVTSWPPKFTSNSPIKKKILEAQDYNSLSLHKIAGLSMFEREIVKLVGTNKTFMYGFLLPDSIQPNFGSPLFFTPDEDALIVLGLETLKSYNNTFRQNAELLSQTLLPVRTSEQIYHRIRNLKKKSYKYGENTIRDYLVNGVLPSPPMPKFLPEVPLPPIHQPKTALKCSWHRLISKVFVNLERFVDPAPATRSLVKLAHMKSEHKISVSPKKGHRKTKLAKHNDSNGPLIMVTGEAEDDSKKKLKKNYRPRKDKKPVLKKTMPFMNEVLSQVAPGHDIFPVNGFNGSTQFYCTVPKFVVIPPESQSQDRDRQAAASTPDKDSDSHHDLVSDNVRLSTHGDSLAISRETRGCDKAGKTPVVSADYSASVSLLRSPSKTLQLQGEVDGLLLRINAGMISKATDRDISRKLGNPEKPILSDEDGEIKDDADVPSEEIDEADDEFEPEPEVVDLCEENDKIFCFRNSKLQRLTSVSKDPSNTAPMYSNQSSSQGDNTDGSLRNNSTSNQNITGETRRSRGITEGSGDEEDDNENPRRRTKESFKHANVLDNELSTETDEEGLPDRKNKRTGAGAGSSGNAMKKPSELSKGAVPKRHKRSPGNSSSTRVGTGHGKRVSKYNTASAETLLRSGVEDQEVRTAYAEAYFSKVQQRIEIENKNPVLFNSYINAFTDFQNSILTEDQFIGKVEELLKDYPDLVREFLGMFQPSQGSSSEHFGSFQESQAQVYFLELLEKWTVNCPQLKAKILHKLKMLRDEPNLTERRIATVIQPFFSQIPNPLMMDAFKALFPSVFRPETMSSASDFEEIDLDMEESKQDSSLQQPLGDIEATDGFEVVKLPDEKSVPATNTCSCPCHRETSNISFYTRAKHCNKCRLKFQDGKVFVHSGRIMKPVSVEFANPDLAKRISAGSACVSCRSPTRRLSDTVLASSVGLTTEDPETEQSSTAKKVKPSAEPTPDTQVDLNSDQPCTSSGDSSIVRPWTLTEDRTILISCQTASDIESGITELSNIFTDRSISEIKSRFTELYNLMQDDSESGS